VQILNPVEGDAVLRRLALEQCDVDEGWPVFGDQRLDEGAELFDAVDPDRRHDRHPLLFAAEEQLIAQARKPVQVEAVGGHRTLDSRSAHITAEHTPSRGCSRRAAGPDLICDVNAAPRDLARFAMMMLNDGAAGGRQIVAPDIIATLETGGSREAFTAGPGGHHRRRHQRSVDLHRPPPPGRDHQAVLPAGVQRS
jgi:hypothetical protein